jgi:hypothetical protein
VTTVTSAWIDIAAPAKRYTPKIVEYHVGFRLMIQSKPANVSVKANPIIARGAQRCMRTVAPRSRVSSCDVDVRK